MPYPGAAYQRAYRKRRKAAGGPLTRPVEVPEAAMPAKNPAQPKNPARAVADWAKKRLIVPFGHRNAGKPLVLPAYFVKFLSDALAPGVREAGCFVARKNAKSACVAALVLAYLADDGPLRRRGWRCGVASVSKEKAGELWQQIEDMISAAGLAGMVCGKVPRHVRSAWGRADFLSADRTSGHASGFDLAVVDELGLFPEKGRDLVSGLLSSTSARDGRLLAISVLGDSPLSHEMVARESDESTVVHVHRAPDGCRLDDEAAWRLANPTLGEIKSESYMQDMARRASANPPEQSAFRCYDLNQPGSPSVEMICDIALWNICAHKLKPERAGPCYVGFDLGGSASMTAGAAYWPATGRLDCWGAFGDLPSLADRGAADGIGERYVTMERRGELRTWPGRVTPVSEFLAWLAEELATETVALAAADRYRQAEGMDALSGAGAAWPMEWRAQGAGKDGSADVRAFQKATQSGTVRPGESLLIESAISESAIRYDGNGNPALDKGRSRGRIDALSAAVLAVGIGSRAAGQSQGFFYHVPNSGHRRAG